MSQNPDEQTTPAPDASPAPGASLPAFLPPRAPRSRPRRPSSPRSLNPSQGVPDPSPADEGDDASAWGEEPQPPETDSTSYPASTEAPPAARFRPIDPSTRKMYAAAVTQGATIASGLVNSRMDPEGAAFIMRPDEAAGVADPASRLLARHVPLSAAIAGQATDLSDIVELLTALVGYVVASFSRRAAGMVEGGLPPNDHEGDTSDYRGPATPVDDAASSTPAGPVIPWPMPNMPPRVGA